MAQFSVAISAARIAALETEAGVSPFLQFRTGSAPANCAAASTGTLVAELALIADWLPAPVGGVSSMVAPIEANAAAAGTIAHFRLMNNAKTVCLAQGTVTLVGGGGDIELDQLAVNAGQLVRLSTLTFGEI